MDNFIYSKNKIKLKLRNEGRSLGQKKILSTAIKNNLNSSIILNNTRTDNKLENSSNGLFTVEKSKNKLLEAVKSIEQKNLFKKKSCSQINIRRNNIKNNTNLSMIVKKKKEDKKENLLPIINSKEIKIQKNIFRNSSKIKKTTLSPISHEMKTYSPLINPQNPDINKISASPEFVQRNAIFNNSNSNETKGSSNHSGSNNNIIKMHSDSKLPFPLHGKDKNKNNPLSVGTKLKNDNNVVDDPGEFVRDYSGSEEDSINKISSKNIEFYDEETQMDSNEVYLYKFNEDDIQNIMTKYYAKLSKKEIVFFSSDLKNELYDLWFIYNAFISTGKRKSK